MKFMKPSPHLQAAFKTDHCEEVAATAPPLHPTNIIRITTYRRLLAGFVKRGVSGDVVAIFVWVNPYGQISSELQSGG